MDGDSSREVLLALTGVSLFQAVPADGMSAVATSPVNDYVVQVDDSQR